tara:strand:+ start:140 stop:1387 length:1248 start_codon:yes stop_codon:yes gene_type:complete
MAITDKKQGVWDTEEVYNKQNEGLWGYSSAGAGKALWGWGYNDNGQLGLNTTATKISSPTQVGTDTTWASLQGGRSDISFAIKSDGTMWSWGNNFNGCLGLNDAGPVKISSPTQIPGTNWRSVGSMGPDSYYATKFDGTLWAWGCNEVGVLGLNDTDVDRSSPTQVGTDTSWNILNHSAGRNSDNGMALKNNGTLWAWGVNSYGALGLGDKKHRSSPIQVGTDTTWKSFTTTWYGARAIKTDGTLWSWGYNVYGELGLNLGGPAPGGNKGKSSPTQVGTDTDWDTIASSSYQGTFALKTDGTMWAWGRNTPSPTGGFLGLNDKTSRSSPTQVGGTTWTSSMSAFTTSGNIKNDGTLWTWGSDFYGELGQNSYFVISSPKQVGTDTNWYNRTGADPHYVRTIANVGYSFLALRTPS